MKSLKRKIRRLKTVMRDEKAIILTVTDDKGLIVDAENSSKAELQSIAAKLFKTVYKLKS